MPIVQTLQIPNNWHVFGVAVGSQLDCAGVPKLSVADGHYQAINLAAGTVRARVTKA